MEHRPTQAVVNLAAVSHNIREVRKKIGPARGLMAVVKADGYGHGAVQVSRAALKAGADCLGVALPEEGTELRKAGIQVPVLVLGLIQPREVHKVLAAGLEQTVCTWELAQALDQQARSHSAQVNVHLKIDTGMGRVGASPGEALSLARKIKQLPNLNLKGIFSHFSSADEEDKTFAKKQMDIFQQVVGEIQDAGISIPQKHLANGAAILDLPQSYLDLVRPGIMIYGLYPSSAVSRSIELRPAMTFKTRIAYLKRVPPGTPISYGRTYYTDQTALVGTLPVGYADGYSRLLSNKAQVLVNGRRAPIIGRVCMDMCMVDLSQAGTVQQGDEVILFGEGISADEIAALMGTINYEVVCAVNKRVPRIYVEH